MKKLLFVSIVILVAVQLAIVLTWFSRSSPAPRAPIPPGPPRNYMAHGTRTILLTLHPLRQAAARPASPVPSRLSPDTVAIRCGDSLTVSFSFACDDVRFGDRIFATLIVEGDSRSLFMDSGTLDAPHPIQSELTHCIENGKTARGWTLKGLRSGDTATLAAQMRIDRPGEYRMLAVMEKDPEEPEESQPIERRVLSVMADAGTGMRSGSTVKSLPTTPR